MVNPTERHRELVADLATERARLRRPEVMRLRGLAPANQARLRGNELTMFFVAQAPRFADRKHAFVDASANAAGRVAELARAFLSIVGVRRRTHCRDMRQRFGNSR